MFSLAFLLIAMAEASVRQLAVSILLSQSDRAAETDKLAINFANTIVGSAGKQEEHTSRSRNGAKNDCVFNVAK